MNLLLQIGIVFFVCFCGQVVESLLPFPFPASVIAMILLFLALQFRIIKTSHIDQKADFLLKNMSFFFIPAGVEIMNYFTILQNIWLQFLVICLVSTILTFLAAAYTVQLVQYLLERRKKSTHRAMTRKGEIT